MSGMTPTQHFLITLLVIGGYLIFGALAVFVPIDAHQAIFVTTVLATMGPLVGWVIKGQTAAASAAPDSAPSATDSAAIPPPPPPSK